MPISVLAKLAPILAPAVALLIAFPVQIDPNTFPELTPNWTPTDTLLVVVIFLREISLILGNARKDKLALRSAELAAEQTIARINVGALGASIAHNLDSQAAQRAGKSDIPK